MAGVHSRARWFDAAAAAYERGRPGWPPEAVEIAARRLGLAPDAAVLDLAAGTGKLTRVLADRFASVAAVEPLDGMRAILEAQVPRARALAGTAEAIPLPDAAVDAVFVGEAFHWFDLPRATAEIARVLRPGGGVAVLHNELDWKDQRVVWRAATDAALERHWLPHGDVDPQDRERWGRALAVIGERRADVAEHVQRLDRDGLLALISSFSRVAGLPPARRDAALEEVGVVLDRHGVRDVELTYRAEVTTFRAR